MTAHVSVTRKVVAAAGTDAVVCERGPLQCQRRQRRGDFGFTREIGPHGAIVCALPRLRTARERNAA
jgi:hypothetical protein